MESLPPGLRSIWLLPGPPARRALDRVIERCHDGAPFPPHITLVSGVPRNDSVLEDALVAASARLSASELPVLCLGRGDSHWFSRYLEFAPWPGFTAARGAASLLLDVDPRPGRPPHLSLCYGSPREEPTHPELPTTVRIDRVASVLTEGPPDAWTLLRSIALETGS